MSQGASVFLPLTVPEHSSGASSARLISHLTWAFVGIGVLLRLARYLLQFPLWGDECFVAVNYIDTGFADMLRPLKYSMVCPLLVLWSQLASVKLLGFNELSLRLPATLASLASLFVFRYLSSRVLQGWPWLLAVGIFSVSYYPIRHGCEVKPYAMDLLAALVLLTLAVEWLLARERPMWWWLLAAVTPIAMGFSYTAIFVAGGISLALAWAVYQTQRRPVWLAFLAYNAVAVASFAGWYLLVARAQAEAYEAAGLKTGWNVDFPPTSGVSALGLWLIDRHTSHMFSYPIGGPHGGSTATAILVAVALGVLCRQRRWTLAALCMAPLALCFVAAALHRYPYGGSQRTMQFFAPAVCILAGLGLATVVATCARWRAGRGAPAVAVGFLIALGIITLGRDLLHPYKTPYDDQSREFARWFWPEQGRDADLACCIRDLDMGLDRKYSRHSNVAVYLCNQAIYSKGRHGLPDVFEVSVGSQSAGIEWAGTESAGSESAGTERRPLRCVTYGERLEELPEFGQWLAGAGSRYELRGSREYHVNSGVDANYDFYVVYEFVPRPK